ncbi:Predicted PurR-regulated permease PerM [Williamsia sterculiae]|uniref:Predicted PurR-regulated permease PerM n=1 Tax=Williamsia sterculiae TaxID=1344003 RepID=A0A1N7FTU8_9NOCA|nr:Predicted PurR-regulated permease PerM [Williamsia sterculiae]
MTRASVFLSGLRGTATVSLQVILVAGGAAVLLWVIGELWVAVLPVLLSLVVCTVLWPPTRWLRNRGLPPAAAALLTLLLAMLVVAGVIAAIAPSVVQQSSELADQASDGITKVQEWAQGPPLNITDDQLNSAVTSLTQRLQSSSATIASGFFTGISATTSALVTIFSALVITFFLLKDGTRFLPWLRRNTGQPVAGHLGEVLSRVWATLGGFIRTQALVSLVDAFFIGLGLVILGVPLAYALAIVTFIGGFVPIVGAFVAGALAVLVALVSKGVVTALIVLAIILAVQQLEGNVLQPWLQSKSMNLHAVIVLLAVTVGSSLFGIVGAFLAVPAAASGAVVIRYLNEQIALRAGEPLPEPDDEPPPKAGWWAAAKSRLGLASRGDSASDGGGETEQPV